MAARVACVIAAIGSPLTGKGLLAHEWIARPHSGVKLVWSAVEKSDNYAGLLRCERVASISSLVSALVAGRRAVVFVPSLERDDMLKQFDRFCRVAWECSGARLLVEELSRVTQPSWAPPAWKNLTTSGSHQGLEVFATAQRPAQVDKDFLGGCTEIRCYRCNEEPDARRMSSALGPRPDTGKVIPWEQLAMLPDRHYWHLWRSPRRLVEGVQAIPGERRKKKSPPGGL